MEDNNEKISRHKIQKHLYMSPKEIRNQLLFFCRYKNIAPSTLCSTLVKRCLARNNVAQMMIDYAIEQVEINSKKD